jgi:hypothetical protein
VALCQARISTKPLWGFSSSNPYHSQSRAEHLLMIFCGQNNLIEMKTNLRETVKLIHEKTLSQKSWETVPLRLD